jgi:hypothetical protein
VRNHSDRIRLAHASAERAVRDAQAPSSMRDMLDGLGRTYLLTVLVLSLVLRIGLILNMGDQHHFKDTLQYDLSARSILHGSGPDYSVPRAALYPAFMAFAYTWGGEGNFRAVRWLQLPLGVALVGLCGMLAYRMAGARAGRIALVASALSPMLVFATGLLYPTTLYACLLITAVLLTWEMACRPRVLPAVAIGLLLALVWLADPIAMVPAAALLVWLGWSAWNGGARAWLRVGLACGVTLLAVAAWVKFSDSRFGGSGVNLDKAQYVMHIARNDSTYNQGRRIRDTGPFRPTSMGGVVGRELHLLRTRPVDYLHDWSREFMHFFSPWPDRITSVNSYTRPGVRLLGIVYLLPILVLAAIGLVRGPARAHARSLLLVPTLSTAFIYAFFITQARYRVPVEPCLIVLAAIGLTALLPARVPWLGAEAARHAAVAKSGRSESG